MTRFSERNFSPPRFQPSAPGPIVQQYWCVMLSATSTGCDGADTPPHNHVGAALPPQAWEAASVTPDNPHFLYAYRRDGWYSATRFVPGALANECAYGHAGLTPTRARLLPVAGELCGGGLQTYVAIKPVDDSPVIANDELHDSTTDTRSMPWPANPAPGLDGLESYLESPEATTLREFIDWWLNNFPAPDAIADKPGSDLVAAPPVPPLAIGSENFVMPDCRGITVSACEQLLQQRGAQSVVTVQVATFHGAQVTLPAETVVTQSVPADATVPKDRGVILLRNPDAPHMPAIMPSFVGQPLPSEVGVRVTTRTRRETAVPAFDPDAVTEQSPAPGTRVASNAWPDGEPLPDGVPEVTVIENPAPDPVSSAPGPDAIPAVNFDPLLRAIGCDRFPFGVPCWVYDSMKAWVVDASAPRLAVPFPMVTPDPIIDLAVMDPGMPLIRSMVLLLFTVSVWMFFAAKAQSNGGAD